MSLRGTVIWLYERPCTDPWQPGHCKWCGDLIVLVDPTDYRRARREVHYGDEHEVGGLKCRAAMNGQRTWNARYAVRYAARERGALACVDCGVVVEEYRDGRWCGLQWEVVTSPDPRVPAVRHHDHIATGVPGWEADHEVPLIDGGEHALANLRCRCDPCHAAKTAREAAARAAARVRAARSRRPGRQLTLHGARGATPS